MEVWPFRTERPVRSTPTLTVILVAFGSTAREPNSRATPSDIISALDHPLRRSILRLLYEEGPASAEQIAGRFPYAGPSSVRSHLGVLVRRGMAMKERRGSNEILYSPVEEAPIGWVATILIVTAEED